jgi:acetoin utilization deacetylase AcuC-like enzyme
VPLAAWQHDERNLSVRDEIVRPAAESYQPDLVLVSECFDAHQHDPLGGMRVTESGFAAMAKRLVDLAELHAEGRLVALLEGGYDPDALGRSVATVLRVLDGEQ